MKKMVLPLVLARRNFQSSNVLQRRPREDPCTKTVECVCKPVGSKDESKGLFGKCIAFCVLSGVFWLVGGVLFVANCLPSTMEQIKNDQPEIHNYLSMLTFMDQDEHHDKKDAKKDGKKDGKKDDKKDKKK